MIVSYISHSIQAISMRHSSYIGPPNRLPASLENGCPRVRYYPNLTICGQDCEVTQYRARQPRLKKCPRRNCGHGRFADGFQKGGSVIASFLFSLFSILNFKANISPTFPALATSACPNLQWGKIKALGPMWKGKLGSSFGSNTS